MRSWKRTIAGSVVVGLAMVVSLGVPAGAILNGKDATSSTTYGDVGSLWATSSSIGSSYLFICSGIFVTPTVFITAAHCIAETDAYAAQFSLAAPDFHISTSSTIAGCSAARPCAQPPCWLTAPCTTRPSSWIAVTGIYLNHAFHLGTATSSYTNDQVALSVAVGKSGLQSFGHFPRDPVVGYLNTLQSERKLNSHSTFSVYGFGSGSVRWGHCLSALSRLASSTRVKWMRSPAGLVARAPVTRADPTY